ncbi:DUF7577 domain-containing protein [Halosimplex amylolyticum]|uniref:DUF7577 domain-containing protein n=1 Tax=Halosimplex amylolyticum TaxID=3396616 RepID=UPI003F54C991
MVSEVLWLLGLVVLIFLPGLCFVALFRLIDYVAHDELIARVENGEMQSGCRTGSGSELSDGSSGATSGDSVRCPSCGAENWGDATYCGNCLTEI